MHNYAGIFSQWNALVWILHIDKMRMSNIKCGPVFDLFISKMADVPTLWVFSVNHFYNYHIRTKYHVCLEIPALQGYAKVYEGIHFMTCILLKTVNSMRYIYEVSISQVNKSTWFTRDWTLLTSCHSWQTRDCWQVKHYEWTCPKLHRVNQLWSVNLPSRNKLF